jgi:hypothetical protein
MPDNMRLANDWLRPAAIAAVASVVWHAIAFCAVGYNLDFILIGCAGVAILFPFIIASRDGLPDIAAAAGGAMVAAWIIWIAIGRNMPEMTAVAALVLAGLIAEGAAVRLLVRADVDAQLAPAAICIVTLAWLLWPVWLMTAPPLLLRFHPLLLVNSAVSADLSVWTEEPVPYKLSQLGQDVPYALPERTLVGTVAYASLALALMLLGSTVDRRPATRAHAGYDL